MRCFIIHLINKIKLVYNNPIKIVNRIVAELPCSYRIRAKIFGNHYTRVIYSKLTKYFNKSLLNVIEHRKSTNNNCYNSNIIWIFWWQGKSQMPLIVKKCFKSVKDHANGHKVILLTKYNVKKYSNIPAYIYIKLYHRDIDLTHFSDVLRFNLLDNYGGLWIDSTMYCTSDIGNEYFTNLYSSGNYGIEQSHKCFFGKWTEFLIGGRSHEMIFDFMNEFFKLYLTKNNYLIDYFLADYALDYAYHKNISGFYNYVNNIASHNNPKLYCLVNYLNKKYNYNDYKYLTKDTNMFKLTYKRNFYNKSGTFYNKLINNKLY